MDFNVIKNLLNLDNTPRPQKVGICLSGGGALGFAHIGVLQALEDHNIYPEVVSGCSMGAIIGALYAYGYSPSDMLKMIKEDKFYKVSKLMQFSINFQKSGVSNHHTLRKLIKDAIPENNFECLKKEFYICVSNLTKGEPEIISDSKNLDIWVAASSAIPAVFYAMKINDMIYVDGGVTNNFPAQILRDKCKFIIGSEVCSHDIYKDYIVLNNAVTTSMRAVTHRNSIEGHNICDFLIVPQAVNEYHEFNFEAYEKIYLEGYRATTKAIAKQPKILELRTN